MYSAEDCNIAPGHSKPGLEGFNVYETEDDHNAALMGVYRICLMTGRTVIHYADKHYEINGTVLFFGNPHLPYTWECTPGSDKGYACHFTESFLKEADCFKSLQQLPFFKIGETPVLNITNQQWEFLSSIFQKMIEEQHTDYIFKYGLIRNYINLVIYEALKSQPVKSLDRYRSASHRIAADFLALLEDQFPVVSAFQPLTMRRAQDYAKQLSIHVNHLNKAVKEFTGKPTTTVINERVAIEAKLLLQRTGWNVADVAYALGFEYTTYFNNFFKRMTNTNPKAIRGKSVYL